MGKYYTEPRDAYALAVGRHIESLRREMGFKSGQELARATGLSQDYVRAVERGLTWMSLDRMVKLAAGLGVSVQSLIPGNPAQRTIDEAMVRSQTLNDVRRAVGIAIQELATDGHSMLLVAHAIEEEIRKLEKGQ